MASLPLAVRVLGLLAGAFILAPTAGLAPSALTPVEVTPSEGHVGDGFSISAPLHCGQDNSISKAPGSGSQPEGDYSVYWDSDKTRRIGGDTTSAADGMKTSLTIPEAAPGTHSIWARCDQLERGGTGYVKVLHSIAVTSETSPAQAGGTVNLVFGGLYCVAPGEGSVWSQGGPFEVVWSGNGQDRMVGGDSGGQSDFTLGMAAPDQPGTYAVSARCTGKPETASPAFTLTVDPALSPSPATITPGPVTTSPSPVSPSPSPRESPNESSTGPGGEATPSATPNKEDHLHPELTLNPWRARRGDTVELAGTGFPPRCAAYRAVMDGGPLDLRVHTAGTEVTGHITVPLAARPGDHTVRLECDTNGVVSLDAPNGTRRGGIALGEIRRGGIRRGDIRPGGIRLIGFETLGSATAGADVRFEAAMSGPAMLRSGFAAGIGPAALESVTIGADATLGIFAGPPSRSTIAAALISPHDIDLARDVVALGMCLFIAVILALAFGLPVLLLPKFGFPADIFNKAVEELHDDRIPLRRLSPLARLGLFAGVSAILLTTIDDGLNSDRDGLALTVLKALALVFAFFLATVTTTVTYALASDRRLAALARRDLLWGGGGTLRTLPAALVFALLCAVISNIGQFHPGYVYGLVAGYLVTVRRGWRDDARRRWAEGQSILAGSAATFGVAVLIWLFWAPVDAAVDQLQGDAPVDLMLLDTGLAAFALTGFSTVLFSLLPLHLMDGAKLLAWNKKVWAAVFVPTAAVFVYLTLKDGLDKVTPAQFRLMLLVFLVFFLLTTVIWLVAWWHVNRRERAATLR